MPIHPVLRSSCSALALASLLTCGACGGGGGSGGNTTSTFVPSTDVTFVGSAGTIEAAPGLHLGHFAVSGKSAGVRFPLFPFVDANDTIVSAKLRMKQSSTVGSPYTTGGNVVVDFVDFGMTLGAGDNAAPVITANIGTLSTDATVGYKEVDVTAQVVAAAAANDFFVDFIVRFSALALNPEVEEALFEDVEGGLGSADRPELVVTYQ